MTGELDSVALQKLIAQIRDATAVLALEAAEQKIAAITADLIGRSARRDARERISPA
jgi:hypothetical protein